MAKSKSLLPIPRGFRRWTPAAQQSYFNLGQQREVSKGEFIRGGFLTLAAFGNLVKPLLIVGLVFLVILGFWAGLFDILRSLGVLVWWMLGGLALVLALYRVRA